MFTKRSLNVVVGGETLYRRYSRDVKGGLEVRNGICKSEGEGIKCGERKE